MDKARIGIIGCGSIARKRHLPELALNPNAVIALVCDVVESRAQEMARMYGCDCTLDYQALIARADIDAVIVCATNTTHAQMSIEALEAGKHVLCEKPMATSLVDAENMIATAKRTGKYLMIGHNQRLAPGHIKAKELLQSGKLGKIDTFRTTFGHRGCEYWAIDGANTWFFEKRIAALGSMGDLGVHKADLMRWLLGEEFVEAAAFVDVRSKRDGQGRLIDNDDNACCLLRTASGVYGTMTASWTYMAEDNSTTIYCSGATMEIYKHPGYDVVVTYADGSKEYHSLGGIQTNDKQSDSGVSRLFVESIVSNTPPEIDGKEGYEALKIVLGCMRSAETAQMIKL